MHVSSLRLGLAHPPANSCTDTNRHTDRQSSYHHDHHRSVSDKAVHTSNPECKAKPLVKSHTHTLRRAPSLCSLPGYRHHCSLSGYRHYCCSVSGHRHCCCSLPCTVPSPAKFENACVRFHGLPLSLSLWHPSESESPQTHTCHLQAHRPGWPPPVCHTLPTPLLYPSVAGLHLDLDLHPSRRPVPARKRGGPSGARWAASRWWQGPASGRC